MGFSDIAPQPGVVGRPYSRDCGTTRPRRRVSVCGLVIPSDERRPCHVREVGLTVAALSDAIGGGLLDEGLIGEVDGAVYCVYLDEERVPKGLVANQRLAVLSAQLGHAGSDWLASLRGDALVLGCDEHMDDIDVPAPVVQTARRLAPDATSAPGKGRVRAVPRRRGHFWRWSRPL